MLLSNATATPVQFVWVHTRPVSSLLVVVVVVSSLLMAELILVGRPFERGRRGKREEENEEQNHSTRPAYIPFRRATHVPPQVADVMRTLRRSLQRGRTAGQVEMYRSCLL